jgi:hypothetical protein
MQERNQGLDWPLAVDLWLDWRVIQARAAGMLTSRKELSAALLTSQAPNDDELVDLVRAYRRRTAGNLLGMEQGASITFIPKAPGPRNRRGG